MNWINELYELYEKNKSIAGDVKFVEKSVGKKQEQVPLILLPVFHTTVTAQITVTIDGDGNFIRADAVPGLDKLTIIPVTEGSGSRTQAVAPHPFCDNLKYLAGDYMEFYRQEKKPKDFTENHQKYMENLKKWKSSNYSHDKVNALYVYLNKDRLIRDLAGYKIIPLDEEGLFDEKEKIQGIDIKDAFIRFRILDDSQVKECWLDKTLQESYIKYYFSTLENKDLCYLTGETVPVTYLQPKKIRHEGDGAKLISSNDDANYTFRGRFEDKQQAFSIGYEASQKVQNALKWIIRRQGYSVDELYIVVWETGLQAIPKWNEDTDNLSDTEGLLEDTDWYMEAMDDEAEVQTGEIAAAKFGAAMRGYGNRLDDTSRVVLLALDAATTGRLALVENKVFDSARYLENIKYWHESCFWEQVKFKDEKYYRYFGMAGVTDIVLSIYGTEQNGILTVNNKKLYANACRRLLPCISERKRVPVDMIRRITVNASSPQSYDKRYNWEKVLCIACALIKKEANRNKTKEGEWTLEMNLKSTDRSYLYGRLLAVADRVEYSTYTEDEKKRVTNASRYMQAFSQRPYQTWQMVFERIQPYLNKMDIGLRRYYLNMIEEIKDKFTVASFENNTKLEGLYLLGYFNQIHEMKKKKDEKAISELEENK